MQRSESPNGMEAASLTHSIMITTGDAMAKPVSSGQRNKLRGKSASRAKYKELPVSHWAHAVAMLTEHK